MVNGDPDAVIHDAFLAAQLRTPIHLCAVLPSGIWFEP